MPTVVDLRAQLQSIGLDSSGLKAELETRLAENDERLARSIAGTRAAVRQAVKGVHVYGNVHQEVDKRGVSAPGTPVAALQSLPPNSQKATSQRRTFSARKCEKRKGSDPATRSVRSVSGEITVPCISEDADAVMVRAYALLC